MGLIAILSKKTRQDKPEKLHEKIISFTLKAIMLLVIVSGLAVAGFSVANKQAIEKKLVFRPSQKIWATVPELTGRLEKSSFINSENLKITYWHIKGAKKSPVVVYCHGNSENFSFPKNQRKLLYLSKQGYGIFSIDYRGYADSKGEPSESGVYTDIKDFISFLGKKYNLKPRDIIIYGHSLGGAIAIDIASKEKFRAVIVDSSFTSIEDMRKYIVENVNSGNPVSDTIRNYIYNSINITQKFDSKSKVSRIKSPVLFVHAKPDVEVPWQMSVILHKLKPDSKIFISKTGGHRVLGWEEKSVLKFLSF